MAWEKIVFGGLLKRIHESIDICTGHHGITEIALKRRYTIYNQSMNQSLVEGFISWEFLKTRTSEIAVFISS